MAQGRVPSAVLLASFPLGNIRAVLVYRTGKSFSARLHEKLDHLPAATESPSHPGSYRIITKYVCMCGWSPSTPFIYTPVNSYNIPVIRPVDDCTTFDVVCCIKAVSHICIACRKKLFYFFPASVYVERTVIFIVVFFCLPPDDYDWLPLAPQSWRNVSII